MNWAAPGNSDTDESCDLGFSGLHDEEAEMARRKRYAAACKAKVALEALKDERTVPELAAPFEVPPTLIHQGKRSLLGGASGVFERGRSKRHDHRATWVNVVPMQATANRPR